VAAPRGRPRLKRRKKFGLRRKTHLTTLGGRPRRIDDESLRRVRDHLLLLSSNTWGDIGWTLGNIKEPADVPKAFESWHPEAERLHVIRSLLRPRHSEDVSWPCNRAVLARELESMIKRLDALGHSIREVTEQQQRCRGRVNEVDRALTRPLRTEEQNRLVEERSQRKRTLDLTNDTYVWLGKSQQELSETLQDGQAYFARLEVVEFCTSHRYRLQPIHVANALAGLPFIGWRESVKRCSALKGATSNGPHYEMFQCVRRIIKSWKVERGRLTDHAKHWLRTRPSRSPAMRQLTEKFRYLLSAIETSLESTSDREQLPFRVTAEYMRRVTRPEAIDLIFEEDERVIPDKMESKKKRASRLLRAGDKP
jgi:hypothetical protein